MEPGRTQQLQQEFKLVVNEHVLLPGADHGTGLFIAEGLADPGEHAKAAGIRDPLRSVGLEPEVQDDNGLQYPQHFIVNFGINISL